MLDIPLEALPVGDSECKHTTYAVYWAEQDGEARGKFVCLCVRDDIQNIRDVV